MTAKSRDEAAEEYVNKLKGQAQCVDIETVSIIFKAGWDAAIKFTQADQTGLDRIKRFEHRPTTDGPFYDSGPQEGNPLPYRNVVCDNMTLGGYVPSDEEVVLVPKDNIMTPPKAEREE